MKGTLVHISNRDISPMRQFHLPMSTLHQQKYVLNILKKNLAAYTKICPEYPEEQSSSLYKNYLGSSSWQLNNPV